MKWNDMEEHWKGPVGRRVAFCSTDVWYALKRDPKLVESVRRYGGNTNDVSLEEAAAFLGVNEIVVGIGLKNTIDENLSSYFFVDDIPNLARLVYNLSI